MKSLLKISLYIILFLVVLLTVIYFVFNKEAPIGMDAPKADILAEKVSANLNKKAWDSTAVLAWSNSMGNDYVWNKEKQFVSVKWGENFVLLNLKTWANGKAFVNNTEIKDEKLDVLRGKAWSLFCNDSYWLIAPFKIFDEGVTRTIVKNSKTNTDDLLVSYATGGVTPGDKYLWQLDTTGRPIAYKMWVKIIPIGGVNATWESWEKTKTGFWVANKHKMGPVELKNLNVKSGFSLNDVGINENYFDLIK